MSDTAIRVVGLSKEYRIGGSSQPYKTLRESLMNTLTLPLRVMRSNGMRRKPNKFWALDDVTFEVKQGEVIGIIGRNGAGKSTLLKILSRITKPTRGYVDLYGRVGSLLEVGTGFHPELTGRENIFLNGAILGMHRSEIMRKFDEIVAFSEVEKFIDTAVKHYSSGMYLRLAFAVAAHLEPHILIVDEVLAVGDAAFQRKSLGKMGEVAESGRTVLFVSHQMTAIRKLCQRCIWLDGGKVKMIDSTIRTVSAYETAFQSNARDQDAERSSHAAAQFVSWAITNPKSDQANLLTELSEFTFKIELDVNQPIEHGVHGIALWNSEGQLMWAWSINHLKLQPGRREFHYTLPLLPLRPGLYSWQATLLEGDDMIDNWFCVPELVIATDPQSDMRDQWTGVLNLPCAFQAN